jgi:hypothetical protein
MFTLTTSKYTLVTLLLPGIPVLLLVVVLVVLVLVLVPVL